VCKGEGGIGKMKKRLFVGPFVLVLLLASTVPVSAQESQWNFLETRVTGESREWIEGDLDNENHKITVTEDSITHSVEGWSPTDWGRGAKKYYSWSVAFEFNEPPATLTPGEVITFTVTGTVTASGDIPAYPVGDKIYFGGDFSREQEQPRGKTYDEWREQVWFKLEEGEEPGWYLRLDSPGTATETYSVSYTVPGRERAASAAPRPSWRWRCFPSGCGDGDHNLPASALISFLPHFSALRAASLSPAVLVPRPMNPPDTASSRGFPERGPVARLALPSLC
jgi:hypothetical protein